MFRNTFMALEAVRGGSLFLLVQGGRLRRRLTPALGPTMFRHVLAAANTLFAAIAAFMIYVVMPYSRQLVCESWRMECRPLSTIAVTAWAALPIAAVALSLWAGYRIRSHHTRASFWLFLWYPLFFIAIASFLFANRVPATGP